MTGPLASLETGYRALVFGASGGIGAALVAALASDPRAGAVFAAARAPLESHGKVTALRFAIDDEASIAEAVSAAAAGGKLDLVIAATGLLQDDTVRPERSWRALDPAAMARLFQVNAIGPAVMAKHALGHMPRDRKAVFAALSARVGSISDNRLGGWHSYRAAKAALNMLVRNFAIEHARQSPQALCVALHPGTVDTALSRPFQANVAQGQLFTAQHSAECLLSVIERLTPADSGKHFAWDGAEIPA